MQKLCDSNLEIIRASWTQLSVPFEILTSATRAIYVGKGGRGDNRGVGFGYNIGSN